MNSEESRCYSQGVSDERKAVVAWLKAHATEGTIAFDKTSASLPNAIRGSIADLLCQTMLIHANAITNGEHRKDCNGPNGEAFDHSMSVNKDRS